jgi:excisionase family DNA binding protein
MTSEHQRLRKLVEAYTDPDVAPLVMDKLDEWAQVVEQAREASERAAATSPDAHLSVRQIAEWLNVSQDAVYKLVQAGELPDRRVGGQIRIPASFVRDYLERNTTMRERAQRQPAQRPSSPEVQATLKRYPWLKGA